jgi:HSP20 family molecular chaperone IbpA
MNYSNLCQTGCSIYPGEFVPLMNEEEVKAQFSLLRERESIQLPVTLKETLDTYKMEFALPGFKREELLMLADDNILTIYGIHKKMQNNKLGAVKYNENQYDYFEKRIALPENVDVEFVAATYESGIISFYIPKTNKPVKNGHQIIVVY